MADCWKTGKRLKIPSHCCMTVKKTNVLGPLNFLLPVWSAQNVIHRIYKSSAEKSKVLSWSTLAGMTVQVGKDFFLIRIIISVPYFVFIREETLKKKYQQWAWPRALLWFESSDRFFDECNCWLHGQKKIADNVEKSGGRQVLLLLFWTLFNVSFQTFWSQPSSYSSPYPKDKYIGCRWCPYLQVFKFLIKISHPVVCILCLNDADDVE